MWKMKILAVSVVLLGGLIFGAAIAFAGWGWNSKVDVEGIVISTFWEVYGPNEYKAKITVTVPEEADISLVEIASDVERVKLRHSEKLECTDDGIEATVKYKVKANHGPGAGEAVDVTVSVVGGDVLGQDSGFLKDTMKVEILIPGTCS